MLSVDMRIETDVIKVNGRNVHLGIKIQGIIKNVYKTTYRVKLDKPIDGRTIYSVPQNACVLVKCNNIYQFKGEKQGWMD